MKFEFSELTGLVPMGIEQLVIPDMQMESSSVYDDNHPAGFGRLNDHRGLYKSWCALPADQNPYLQVDLGEIKAICGVGTQGRGKAPIDSYNAWAMSYNVKLTNDTLTWIFIQRNGANKVSFSRCSTSH